jgi:tetratricopeptide (TPR) repeat protein
VRRRFATIVFSLAAIVGGGAALADQTDRRLDPLFTALREAGGEEAARPLEAAIWQIWLQSGNETVDQLMALGVARLNAGDYGRALAAFDRIIALAPRFAEGWNKRATTLYLMERYAESKEDIDRVLALEPRHFGALSGLGLCDLRLNEKRDALAAFRRALAVDPNLPDLKRSIDELEKELGEKAI